MEKKIKATRVGNNNGKKNKFSNKLDKKRNSVKNLK